MNKRKWIWLICLSPLIGLEIYDGIQGAITGLAMKKYCEAEAGLHLYPNVKYEKGANGHCYQYDPKAGCPNKTKYEKNFIPVFGAVSTDQRIYIMYKKKSPMVGEMPDLFTGLSGLVKEVTYYSNESNVKLGYQVRFSPNGTPHFPAGAIAYDLTRSNKFLDVGNGCYDHSVTDYGLSRILFKSS